MGEGIYAIEVLWIRICSNIGRGATQKTNSTVNITTYILPETVTCNCANCDYCHQKMDGRDPTTISQNKWTAWKRTTIYISHRELNTPERNTSDMPVNNLLRPDIGLKVGLI